MAKNGGWAASARKEILDERELTQEYGLSGPWLKKQRRLRKPPPFLRFGRMIKYRRDDIEKFIAAHVVGDPQ